MYYQKTMGFSEWLVSELEQRGWSRSEAARRGGISPSMFDKVINGYAKPGVKFLEGVATAFGISFYEVTVHLQGQGNTGNEDAWTEEMNRKIKLLPPATRPVAEKLLNALLEDNTITTQTEKKVKSKA